MIFGGNLHKFSIVMNRDLVCLLQPDTGKVLTIMGQKHPIYVVTSGDKTQITIMSCISATGYAIPPCIIFQQKRKVDDYLRVVEVPDTYYNVSDSG